MVNPDEFRIVHQQYFNEKAVVTMEHWQVQQWKRGHFAGYRWKALGQYYYGGAWGPTQFSSLEDARACIEKIKAGNPRCEWVANPVETV